MVTKDKDGRYIIIRSIHQEYITIMNKFVPYVLEWKKKADTSSHALVTVSKSIYKILKWLVTQNS